MKFDSGGEGENFSFHLGLLLELDAYFSDEFMSDLRSMPSIAPFQGLRPPRVLVGTLHVQ